MDDIKTQDVSRLEKLLSFAPDFQTTVHSWMTDCGIQNPTWKDYEEFDQDFYCGIGALLAEVIREAENLDVVVCDGYNGDVYVLYGPKYPWQMENDEKNLTKKKVKDIFNKYVGILTDEPIKVEDQSIKDGRWLRDHTKTDCK